MASRRQQQMLEKGARAPEVRLPELGGETRDLRDLLARSPVVLAFFKASCPVCQFTFPYLERLHKASGPDGAAIAIVGVSQDKANATRDFNDEFGVTFPVLLDEASSGYAVSNAFGIHTVPSLFLIGQDGTIALSGHGFDRKDLEAIGGRIGTSPFLPGERVPDFRPG